MVNKTARVIKNIQRMVPGLRKGSVTAELEHGMATFVISPTKQVELIVERMELIFITMLVGEDGPLPQNIISSHEMTGPNKKEAVWIKELKEFTK
tara:strand:- start:19835 stop:20119 length:285 start_codon:yes stop_codon:yes gene_type:complete